MIKIRNWYITQTKGNRTEIEQQLAIIKFSCVKTQEAYRPCCVLSMSCPARREGAPPVLLLAWGGGYSGLFPCPGQEGGTPILVLARRERRGILSWSWLGGGGRSARPTAWRLTPSERTWDQWPGTMIQGPPPPPCGQTHTCENSTFPILRMRAVKMTCTYCWWCQFKKILNMSAPPSLPNKSWIYHCSVSNISKRIVILSIGRPNKIHCVKNTSRRSPCVWNSLHSFFLNQRRRIGGCSNQQGCNQQSYHRYYEQNETSGSGRTRGRRHSENSNQQRKRSTTSQWKSQSRRNKYWTKRLDIKFSLLFTSLPVTWSVNMENSYQYFTGCRNWSLRRKSWSWRQQ